MGRVHFLSEQRTGLYKKYCPGVAQVKNVLCAKNALQDQTCCELEKRGAKVGLVEWGTVVLSIHTAETLFFAVKV